MVVLIMDKIDIYNYAYWGKNYNQIIQELANMALSEQWSFGDKNDYFILKNYMKYTFFKLQEDNSIFKSDQYYIFNTGLFNKYYNSIYVRCIEDSTQESGKKFVDFCTEYELLHSMIMDLPPRANYFNHASDLVFDWHYDIIVNYEHILEDEENKKRLPTEITNAEKQERELQGAIDESIKRVMANYKLAVPQYFGSKIQLLLPLYFGKENKPLLALVLTKITNSSGKTKYLGHTCLTMDMAYNNARLIAKPESNWLLPQNIDSH